MPNKPLDIPDTFLEMHRVGGLEFLISGPITPISIRDQMVRAQMFVERALGEGLISTAENKGLFILGAGLAGVTAAVYASRLDISTTLIEKSDRAFGPQKKCFSRWIDPTQYDWPAEHWDQEVYPWTLPQAPMPWKANYASLLAGMWMQELRTVLHMYGHKFTLEYQTELVDSKLAGDDLLEVTTAPAGKPQDARARLYGAALYANGFGSERSSCGDFKSFDFWETEALSSPNLGLEEIDRKRRVLICGGGDGALQDFLRVVTGAKSAAHIWRQISSYLNPGLLKRLYSEEDQGHRASL